MRRDVNFWMPERNEFMVEMVKCPYHLQGRKISKGPLRLRDSTM